MVIPVATIDAAILSVATDGQSYTIGDRTYTSADLDALRKLRNDAIASARSTQKVMFQRVRMGSIQ